MNKSRSEKDEDNRKLRVARASKKAAHNPSSTGKPNEAMESVKSLDAMPLIISLVEKRRLQKKASRDKCRALLTSKQAGLLKDKLTIQRRYQRAAVLPSALVETTNLTPKASDYIPGATTLVTIDPSSEDHSFNNAPGDSFPASSTAAAGKRDIKKERTKDSAVCSRVCPNRLGALVGLEKVTRRSPVTVSAAPSVGHQQQRRLTVQQQKTSGPKSPAPQTQCTPTPVYSSSKTASVTQRKSDYQNAKSKLFCSRNKYAASRNKYVSLDGPHPPESVPAAPAPSGVRNDAVSTIDVRQHFVQKDLLTLQPGQWLNDAVINSFFILLEKRDEQLCLRHPAQKRSHFFPSFFCTKLLNEGNINTSSCGVYEYSLVKRWSRKVPGMLH